MDYKREIFFSPPSGNITRWSQCEDGTQSAKARKNILHPIAGFSIPSDRFPRLTAGRFPRFSFAQAALRGTTSLSRRFPPHPTSRWRNSFPRVRSSSPALEVGKAGRGRICLLALAHSALFPSLSPGAWAGGHEAIASSPSRRRREQPLPLGRERSARSGLTPPRCARIRYLLRFGSSPGPSPFLSP